jgi:hypothetical protein
MQEMTEEWIDFWMAWLRQQDCRFFYSLNYFAQPLNHMAEGGNTWSPRLTPEWTVRLQRSNPAFVMQQTVRNYAEIFAEKDSATPLTPRAAVGVRYEQTRQRVLHGQALLECMDIVRLDPGEDIIWDLLKRVADLRTLPKEAFFLAESLVKNASEGFRGKHGTQLMQIVKQVRRVRASGIENAYRLEN